SPVSPYFLQKTIDNKMNMTKPSSSQQLLTFTPEMTISNQMLISAQKTKLHMLVAKWIVSDILPFLIISSESFATVLRYLNTNVDLPSCETIKSTIQSAFVIMQKDIKILLNQASTHILNLIVTSGLSPIRLLIEKVRNLVKAISASSSLTQELKELGQSVGEGISILLINDIVDTISSYIQNSTGSEFLKVAATQMSDKIQKYTNEIYDKTAFIAAILDP
ncbi:28516_t:CDS:2, partial [Gigaspora margarita]